MAHHDHAALSCVRISPSPLILILRCHNKAKQADRGGARLFPLRRIFICGGGGCFYHLCRITFLFQSGAGLFPCTVADFGVEHPERSSALNTAIRIKTVGPIGQSGGGAGGRAGSLIVLRWLAGGHRAGESQPAGQQPGGRQTGKSLPAGQRPGGRQPALMCFLLLN